MKNTIFYVRCVLKEGIPRKERKTERTERKEEKYRILFFTSLHSISFCNTIFVPFENFLVIFLYIVKVNHQL